MRREGHPRLARLSTPPLSFPYPFTRLAYVYVGCVSYVWLSSGSCRLAINALKGSEI